MFRTLVPIVVLAVAMTAPSFASAQTPQPPAARSSSRASGRKAPLTGVINLNTASAADLQGLPGIGAKTAARILDYRQKNGPFKKIEELMNVRGVGEKNFLKLKDQITVAAAHAEQNGKP